MVCVLKKSLLALGFVFVSFAFVSARTVSECKTQLKEIAQVLLDKNVDNPKITSFVSKSAALTEEEMIEFCDQILLYPEELGAKSSAVESIKDELISYLRSFVASRMPDVQVDPNFALIYNAQNPHFIVTFVNPDGEIKTRKYALKIKSIGLKFEIAIKIDEIMIIGSGLNYYDSAKGYFLGGGIDLSWYLFSGKRVRVGSALAGADSYRGRDYSHLRSCEEHGSSAESLLSVAASKISTLWEEAVFNTDLGLCLTTAKIKGTDSALVIVGIVFGVVIPLDVSYVFGGEMVPVNA